MKIMNQKLVKIDGKPNPPKNGNKVKVLYTRISATHQNLGRQQVDASNYHIVIEDKISGSVPFFERPGGARIKNMVERGVDIELSVWQIDRLGRDVRDILNTIHYFNSKNICITFVSQGLKTIDADGKENPITKMLIGIIGTVSMIELSNIRERTQQGRELAKLQGKFLGRKKGTTESTIQFLEKHKKPIELLRKGYKGVEIARICNISLNTITKIKKLNNQNL
jgi:DNA invertase Pin-like site-specific DNA recombinase